MDGALRATLEHKTIGVHCASVHGNHGLPVADRVDPPIARVGGKLHAVRILFPRLGVLSDMNALALTVEALGLVLRDLDRLHGGWFVGGKGRQKRRENENSKKGGF